MSFFSLKKKVPFLKSLMDLRASRELDKGLKCGCDEHESRLAINQSINQSRTSDLID